jgi:hypothetical protein
MVLVSLPTPLLVDIFKCNLLLWDMGAIVLWVLEGQMQQLMAVLVVEVALAFMGQPQEQMAVMALQ